jgi:hypothetical protein
MPLETHRAADISCFSKYQGGQMNRLRVVGIAMSLLTLAAGAAVAGEVKGPPGSTSSATAAPANANSECAFSGLNDGLQGQNASQVQTAADSWKFYGLPKGAPGKLGLCKGGTN